jgi:hypothetical protein
VWRRRVSLTEVKKTMRGVVLEPKKGKEYTHEEEQADSSNRRSITYWVANPVN